ncbi:MAG: ABC transporter permease [Planctomycetota bacterium]
MSEHTNSRSADNDRDEPAEDHARNGGGTSPDDGSTKHSGRKTSRSNSPSTGAAGMSVRNLTVTAGDKTLLEDVNAEFREGEITLIVGPSGVGKSILLRIIAGLIDHTTGGIRYSGSVEVDGGKATAGKTGVVFQSFALFDELSPVGNMQLARAAGRRHASETTPDELLKKLRVPRNVPTSRLSGGQRQRLALARTLAYNPPAILYDEPTSGLDPLTGRQVADLIRQTHDEYGKTSVIVTHDYGSLIPIADRIYLLDPVEKTLVEVHRDHWEEIPKRLEPMSTSHVARSEVTEKPSLLDTLKDHAANFFVGTTNVFTAAITGLLSLFPLWRNPGWGLRFFAHYARLVFGPTAWFYLIIAGCIIGFTTTYFTFEFLPYTRYIEPLLIEDLLTALGFAMYRIFIPILATVLIAARCGAAVTSDVGGRQYGNQIDALKTFGTSPRSYLLTPILWSFLIGTPLLNMVAFFVARWTSLVTFVYTHPDKGPDFWDHHYHRGLDEIGAMAYTGSDWLITKLLCCGAGIAVIAYFKGRQPKYSTTDVSRSVTSTIFWATLFVLVIHFAFSLYEFDGAVAGSASDPNVGR